MNNFDSFNSSMLLFVKNNNSSRALIDYFRNVIAADDKILVFLSEEFYLKFSRK